MNICLTEIAKEEGKIDLCEGCCLCTVIFFKANVGFNGFLDAELRL